MISPLHRLIDRVVITPSATNLGELINAVTSSSPTDKDIAYLSQALAASGARLSVKFPAADIASTGGPSSLSTLLCPLYLRAAGFTVPKLGVPGRPAGGVDVLATIPNYRVDLYPAEVSKCLDQCGYAHFLTSKWFTPLDGTLFSLRQQSGAQNVPALVIASLLAKKISAGLKEAGIDIRVSPYGNFGKTLEEARANALVFRRVGSLLGLTLHCFLTDGSQPYQPWIGRGEALVALKCLFEGTANPSLEDHAVTCWKMVAQIAGSKMKKPSPVILQKTFAENLRAQGSSLDRFVDRVSQIEKEPKLTITAQSGGYLQVDLGAIRTTLIEVQARAAEASAQFPDTCGLCLETQHGNFVEKGQPLATVRAPQEAWELANLNLAKAFQITSSQIPKISWPLIEESAL